MFPSGSSFFLLVAVFSQLLSPVSLLSYDECMDLERKEYEKYLQKSYVPKSKDEVLGTKYEGALGFIDEELVVYGNSLSKKSSANKFFLTSNKKIGKIEMEICVKEDCPGETISLCFPSINSVGSKVPSPMCTFDCRQLSNYIRFNQRDQSRISIDSLKGHLLTEKESISVSAGKCMKATWSLKKSIPGKDPTSELKVDGVTDAIKYKDDIFVYEHNNKYFVQFNIFFSKTGCFYIKFSDLSFKISGVRPTLQTVEDPLPRQDLAFVSSVGFYWLVIAGPICLLLICVSIIVLICIIRKKKENSADDAREAATCILVSEKISNHPSSEGKYPAEYTAISNTEDMNKIIIDKRPTQTKAEEEAQVKKVNANYSFNETSIEPGLKTASRKAETKPSIYGLASNDASTFKE